MSAAFLLRADEAAGDESKTKKRRQTRTASLCVEKCMHLDESFSGRVAATSTCTLTIAPDGPFRITWDVVIAIVVIFESFLVPYGVGFADAGVLRLLHVWTTVPEQFFQRCSDCALQFDIEFECVFVWRGCLSVVRV